jgi:hypothetical protein
LPRANYKFEKRQKEIAKKKEKGRKAPETVGASGTNWISA